MKMHIGGAKILSALLIMSLLGVPPIWGAETKQTAEELPLDPSTWHKEPLYIDRFFGKMVFGFENVILGWTEIIKEPYEATELDKSFIVAVGRGALYGAVDTVGGALNFITAPFTFIKIPLPQGGTEGREF